MNTLREALQEYLVLRRSLGYQMYDAGRMLPRFISFLEERQAKPSRRGSLSSGYSRRTPFSRQNGPGGFASCAARIVPRSDDWLICDGGSWRACGVSFFPLFVVVRKVPHTGRL